MPADIDDFGGAEGLSPEEAHRLKMSLHRAIDEVFATFRPRRETVPIEHVEIVDQIPDWDHPFPRGPETVTSSRTFVVRSARSGDEEPVRVWGRIGRTVRDSFDKADRGRWVVFGRISEQSERYYPWLEWVETDTGMVAAEAPDPVDARRGIHDERQAPEFLAGVDLARSEDLFERIAKGRTLRMVLPPDDLHEMIRIAAEIARLRGRPPWARLR